jgi:hypothetical protein
MWFLRLRKLNKKRTDLKSDLFFPCTHCGFNAGFLLALQPSLYELIVDSQVVRGRIFHNRRSATAQPAVMHSPRQLPERQNFSFLQKISLINFDSVIYQI